MENHASGWAQLTAQAQKKLGNVLRQDAAPVAERVMRESIEAEIYAAYVPSYYQRRRRLGAMVFSTVSGDETLFVTSAETASPALVPGYSFDNRYPGAFLEMLEAGNMGFWRRDFPRPAVRAAQEEIDRGRDVDRAIRDGLMREFG